MHLSEFDIDKPSGVRLPSPGKCIYCGIQGVKLTDEHVIPYALGANAIVLEKSCCETCQGVITHYEQEVLKKQLGTFRAQVDAPTRNKRNRPTSVNLEFIEVDDSAQRIRDLGSRSVPVDQAPLALNLWSSPPARLFRTDGSSVDVGAPWTYCDKIAFEALCRTVALETGAKHVAVKLGVVNRVHYLRSLAKTAHAFAVAKLGMDAFKPVLTDLILSRSHDVETFVGDAMVDNPVAEDPANTLEIYLGEAEDGPAAGYLFVRIRLYPGLGSPAHLVVIGKALEDIGRRFEE